MGTVKNPGRFPERKEIMERIRKLRNEGESNKDIANELGIKEAQVRKIES